MTKPYTEEELANFAAVTGDIVKPGTLETYYIVTPDGVLLETITGEHGYPFPFNRAAATAGPIAYKHGGLLFIEDENHQKIYVMESSDPSGNVYGGEPYAWYQQRQK